MNRATRRKLSERDYFTIKAQALREFIAFAYTKNFWGRLRIATRILFKRVKI